MEDSEEIPQTRTEERPPQPRAFLPWFPLWLEGQTPLTKVLELWIEALQKATIEDTWILIASNVEESSVIKGSVEDANQILKERLRGFPLYESEERSRLERNRFGFPLYLFIYPIFAF